MIYNANNYPYRIKWYDEKERADLPTPVRLLFFFTLKEHPVSINLIEKTRKEFPEYFERIDKKSILI